MKNDDDWPTTTRTVEKIEQEKKELAEGKPTPITDAAKERKNNNHNNKNHKATSTTTKAKKEKGPKSKSEFADDFVPYPDTGHDMEQLMNFPEHKQKAVLGEHWPEFQKKYLKDKDEDEEED